MKYLLSISRVLVGAVFIFSGFVKGVDPLGTAYKIEEYFNVFGFEWAAPLALILSILLCTIEFTTGIALIFNAHKRFTASVLLLFMLGFTVLTFIDAVWEKVSDCGCFGDAIKLSNWETFWKNVVLLIFALFIFVNRKSKSRRKRFERDTIVYTFSIIFMVLFCLHNYFNEPVIDFRPWKKGNKMMAEEQGRVENYLIYENINTKELVEIPSEKFMPYYQDTTWMKDHKWVRTKTYDPNLIFADGFSMLDLDDTDHSKEIIGQKTPVWIATIHDLRKVTNKGLRNLKELYHIAMSENLHFVLLTSETKERFEAFLETNEMENAEYYFADEKAIKTMVRSNPGLILLNNATVINKWHYRKFPKQEKMEELNQKLLEEGKAEKILIHSILHPSYLNTDREILKYITWLSSLSREDHTTLSVPQE